MPSLSFPSQFRISTKERMLLKALALGVGENDIVHILDCPRWQYFEMLDTLYEKFDVKNPYYLVKEALRKGVIEHTNFIDEHLKTMTLEFVENHQKRFNQGKMISKKHKWELYQLLIILISEKRVG